MPGPQFPRRTSAVTGLALGLMVARHPWRTLKDKETKRQGLLLASPGRYTSTPGGHTARPPGEREGASKGARAWGVVLLGLRVWAEGFVGSFSVGRFKT